MPPRVREHHAWLIELRGGVEELLRADDQGYHRRIGLKIAK
jgi:hypothetical protein